MMRFLLTVACLMTVACTTSSTPHAQAGQEEPAAIHVPPQAWDRIVRDLGGPGTVGFRRVAGPLSRHDGEVADRVIFFGGDTYQILAAEREVPEAMRKAFVTALTAGIRHPVKAASLCAWEPGLFVTITRHIDGDPHQAVVAARGVICFTCGFWAFQFPAERAPFAESMPHDTFNAVLTMAKAVFPRDAALAATAPHP